MHTDIVRFEVPLAYVPDGSTRTISQSEYRNIDLYTEILAIFKLRV